VLYQKSTHCRWLWEAGADQQEILSLLSRPHPFDKGWDLVAPCSKFARLFFPTELCPLRQVGSERRCQSAVSEVSGVRTSLFHGRSAGSTRPPIDECWEVRTRTALPLLWDPASWESDERVERVLQLQISVSSFRFFPDPRTLPGKSSDADPEF